MSQSKPTESGETAAAEATPSVAAGLSAVPGPPERGRLAREHGTMRVMIADYCRDLHGTAPQLCPSCRELLAYTTKRLLACPFGNDKPTCAQCPVHCYAPHPREQVRAIMRHSGPRMLWRHPLLALAHWRDEHFAPPVKARPKRPASTPVKG